MLKRSALSGAIGLAFAPALAVAGALEPAQFRTIRVQAGQGGVITIQIPATRSHDAVLEPYALTGQGGSQKQNRLFPMRLGQGDILLVQRSN